MALWLQWFASVVWTDGLWLLSVLSLIASSRRNGIDNGIDNGTRRRHVAVFAAVGVLLSLVWECYRSQRSTSVTAVEFLLRGLGGHYFLAGTSFTAIHMTIDSNPTRAKKALILPTIVASPYLVDKVLKYGV